MGKKKQNLPETPPIGMGPFVCIYKAREAGVKVPPYEKKKGISDI